MEKSWLPTGERYLAADRALLCKLIKAGKSDKEIIFYGFKKSTVARFRKYKTPNTKED